MKFYRRPKKRTSEEADTVTGTMEKNGISSEEFVDTINPWAIINNCSTKPHNSLQDSDISKCCKNTTHLKRKTCHSAVNGSTKDGGNKSNLKTYVQFDNIPTPAKVPIYENNYIVDTWHASGDEMEPSKDTGMTVKNVNYMTDNDKATKILTTKKSNTLHDEIQVTHRTVITDPKNPADKGVKLKSNCKKYYLEMNQSHARCTENPCHVSNPQVEKTTNGNHMKVIKCNKNKHKKRTKNYVISNVDTDFKCSENFLHHETKKIDENSIDRPVSPNTTQTNAHVDDIREHQECCCDVNECSSDGVVAQAMPRGKQLSHSDNRMSIYQHLRCSAAIRQSLNQLENSITSSGDLNDKYLLKIAYLEADNWKLVQLLEREQRKYRNIFELYRTQADFLAESSHSIQDITECSCGAVYTVHDLEQALCQTDVHVKWLKSELEKLEIRANSLERALVKREAEYMTLREEHMKIKISRHKKVCMLLKTVNDLKTITEALLLALKEKSSELEDVTNNEKNNRKDFQNAQLIQEVTKNKHLSYENILLKKQIVELKLNLNEYLRLSETEGKSLSPNELIKEDGV